MAITKVESNSKERYLSAARTMFEWLRLDAKLAKPEDILKALSSTLRKPVQAEVMLKALSNTLKKPVQAEVAAFNCTVLKDGDKPKFVVHDSGEVSIIGERGATAFLFAAEKAAGFVEYDEHNIPRFMFVAGENYKVSLEMTPDGADYTREFEGKSETKKGKRADFTMSNTELAGTMDPIWLDACEQLASRVNDLHGDMTTAVTLAGIRKK